ncbi:MAG: hopanoid biosynthesis-associated protein HpnK [Chthonomonadales bacterium]
MRGLILNADDFGASPRVNEAVARAFGEGVLTSASLMVSEEASGSAVCLARQHPGLAVGLHLVLSCGSAALPREQIPHLVGRDGRFFPSPAVAGLRVFYHPEARREAAKEIATQFERFADTGVPFDHVNGHQHLHLHPVIWRLVMRQCRRFGVGAVRIPFEELRLFTPGRMVGRVAEWAAFRALRAWCLRQARENNLVTAVRVYGHLETGRVTEHYLLYLLDRLPAGVSEVYLHPGAGDDGDGELEALLSASVRRRMQERGVAPFTYSRLAAFIADGKMPAA